MYPFLISTPSPLLPTYVFIMSMTYCISLLWAVQRADHQGLSRHRTLDYALAIMIFGVVGARLFHVFFEYPDHYLEHPIDVLLLYQGGFVFYGGFLFAFLGGWLVITYHKDNLRIWLDFFTPIIAFGYSIGRIGCFLAGCCYGRASSLPWAVTFPVGVEAPANIALHPTQLYSSILGFLILILILFMEKRKVLPQGGLFYVWLSLHSLSRLLVESFRGDWRGNTLLSWSLSSWISVVLVLASVIGFYYCFQKYKAKDQPI